jgi:hypothetical protein
MACMCGCSSIVTRPIRAGVVGSSARRRSSLDLQRFPTGLEQCPVMPASSSSTASPSTAAAQQHHVANWYSAAAAWATRWLSSNRAPAAEVVV